MMDPEFFVLVFIPAVFVAFYLGVKIGLGEGEGRK